jgi:hypothetical protein
MKIIGAIMVAELRGHKALALGMITLFALLGMTQTLWLYETTPFIAICLQALLLLLVVLVLSKSLWHDAPLRKERYLATRPTNLPKLYLGKYAAFLLMIAAPSALVEFLRVRYFSFDLNIQAAAALQMFLLYAFAIAAFIPVIWWMHSKKSIVLLSTVLLLAAAASNYYFGQLPNSYINEWSAGVPYSPFMILVMISVFATITNFRLLRLKKCHPLISSAIMAVTVLLSMYLAIKISTQQRSNGAVEKCHTADFYAYPIQSEKVMLYKARVPHNDFDPETESYWSFREVTLNDKDYTPWHGNTSVIGSDREEVFRAVKVRYPKVKNYAPRYELNRSATVSVPLELSKEMLFSKKILLSNITYRWKIVMDLPLHEDVKVNSGKISCHIYDVVSPHFMQISNSKGSLLPNRIATISYCAPFSNPVTFPDSNRVIKVFIYTPTTGELQSVSDATTLNNGLVSGLSHDGYRIKGFILSGQSTGVMRDYPKSTRVIILAPEVIEEKLYSWEHFDASHKNIDPK